MLGLVMALGYWQTDTRLPSNPANRDLPADLDYGSIEVVYDYLRGNFEGQLDHDQLILGLKRGLVEALGDPHSEYLDADQYKVLDESLAGQFEGVGIEISDRDGFLTIVAPIDGSPAFNAGLKPKDVILEIDDQPTSQMAIGEALQLIRGPKGSTVNLKIHREGSEPRVFSITRNVIHLPSVKWRVEDQVAIIRISNFDNNTADLLAEAASDILQQGVEGLVLDLRSNPGGDVKQALAVTGFWLSQGKVAVKYYVGGQPVGSDAVSGAPAVSGGRQPVFAGLGTVVLIDGASASASEIVAGALQDYSLATLVGETSFGKGSVQELVGLSDSPQGERLRLTIYRFYTPTGRQIDGVGLTPDIVLANPEPQPDEESEEAVDLQLEEAKILIKESNGQD